jgi:hypothetical protein
MDPFLLQKLSGACAEVFANRGILAAYVFGSRVSRAIAAREW